MDCDLQEAPNKDTVSSLISLLNFLFESQTTTKWDDNNKITKSSYKQLQNHQKDKMTTKRQSHCLTLTSFTTVPSYSCRLFLYILILIIT